MLSQKTGNKEDTLQSPRQEENEIPVLYQRSRIPVISDSLIANIENYKKSKQYFPIPISILKTGNLAQLSIKCWVKIYKQFQKLKVSKHLPLIHPSKESHWRTFSTKTKE